MQSGGDPDDPQVRFGGHAGIVGSQSSGFFGL